MKQFLSFVAVLGYLALSVTAFTLSPSSPLAGNRLPAQQFSLSPLLMSNEPETAVVELADDEVSAEGVVEAEQEREEKVVAPFLSQGEINQEEMDLSDPKQARVMFYIILSLLPVLFLIPLMLGSREMIPAEILPPVEI